MEDTEREGRGRERVVYCLFLHGQTEGVEKGTKKGGSEISLWSKSAPHTDRVGYSP